MLRRELASLVRALEHLPVPRDQHGAILGPGSLRAGTEAANAPGRAFSRAGLLPPRVVSGRAGATVYASNEAGIWQVHAWDSRPVIAVRSPMSRSGSSTARRHWTARGCSGSRTRRATKPGAGSSSRSPAARRRRSSRAFPTAGARDLRRPPASSPRHQRPPGFGIYISLGRRTCARDPPFVGVGSHRRRRRGWLPPRRPLGGRSSPLRRARGARRSDPPRPARARSTHGSDARRAARRGIVSRGTVLVAAYPATSGSPSSTSVSDDERPAIWDLTTGERQDLELDAEGPVFVSDWWPDGRRCC